MSENNQIISYEDMLKAGMHFGRKKTVFNPNMERYVYTVRDGICIIDLLKTQNQLRFSVEFMKKTVKDGGTILFVAPTKQSVESIKELAISLGMPYVLDRWLGGTLTNFKIIASRVKKLEEMEKQVGSEMFERLTKKERLLFNRELDKMKIKFEGLKKMAKLPDIVFVTSLKEGSLPIAEAKKMKVKVVGISNTDSNPDSVDYVVPANDRSKKSIDLIVQAIKKELTSN
jgi:small subunit ribosomal protein S2